MKLIKAFIDPQQKGVPGTLIPLLLMLAGVLAAGILMWALLFGPAAEDYRKDLGAAYAGQQQSALNHTLARLDADLTRVAANPQLQVTLQQGGSKTLDRLLHYQFADNLAIYTHLRGAASITHDAKAPISFAALDMIRRAERGMTVSAEAHQIGDDWRLYIVKPLRASAKAPIAGTMLAVFEMSRLTGALPQLPADAGQITLLQRFPDSPDQPLYQSGNGHGPVLNLPTTNPAWTLQFQAGSALADGAPNPLPLFGAILLALAGALASLTLLQRNWSRALSLDATTLEKLTSGHKVAGLRLSPLEPAAQSIMQLAARAALTPVHPATPPPESPPPMRVVPDESELMFPDDVLDIDIIDDLEEPEPGIPTLPSEIFRAYDIRGVVGKTLTADYVYWIGRAIGSESIDRGQANVAVARDGRLSGPELMAQLIRGLTDSGCLVRDLGMVPTPVLYFATHTTDATSGVMLTGSHNPPDYNGLKVVIAGETLSGPRIDALRQRLEDNDLSEGDGSSEALELLESYCNRITEDVLLARPLKVVIDCGNGVAGVVAEQLLERLGCEVTALYCEVDGNFPNHHPDPSKDENLRDLQLIVKQQQADLGIAFDGDADRLGVVTANGEIICPDRLLMLFADDIVTRNPGADIVFDVKCTRQLPQLISQLGGRPVMWKSGHSMIKAKMRETQALLGGEMSGHIFFEERWYGFDDGLYSAARLLELISMLTADRNEISSLFSRYTVGVSTPELHVTVGEERKFALMDALLSKTDWGEQAQITTIDGVRVDYPDGWGLVRASNTTPVLVLRFEADDQAGLQRIRQLFRSQLAQVAPDLELDAL